MSDLKPVSKPPFLLDGRGTRVLALVVVALLIALIKPWGPATEYGPAALAPPVTTATPPPTSRPTLDIGDGITRPYDPLIFGDKELQPTWGLWPAGYLVTFGFAMHTESSAAPESSGARPSASATPTDPGGPVWPDAIDIPVGNHLLLIGVSMPLGYQVQTVRLRRVTGTDTFEDIPTVRPTSPWPTHFAVIAVDSGLGPDRPAFWLPGLYRLDLSIDPGPIDRSVEVRVEAAAVATPHPSVAPKPTR